MNERVVYFNGSFVPEREALLSIYDTAIATGEKVVEVSRTFDHKIYGLDSHLDRLYSGLAELRINPGLKSEEMRTLTYETLGRVLLTQPRNVDWQILHYVSRGPASMFEIFPEEDLKPTVVIQCVPLVRRLGKAAARYTDGVDLVVVKQKAIPSEVISPQIKSNGRMDHVVGRLEAAEIKRGSIGVLLDSDGYVTESTGSSLFIVSGGNIQTAHSSRVLEGVTREMVFDIAKELGIHIEESAFTPEDAMKASEIFITSTVISQVHARSFNGQRISDGSIGSVTGLVRKAFSEKIGVDFAQ